MKLVGVLILFGCFLDLLGNAQTPTRCDLLYNLQPKDYTDKDAQDYQEFVIDDKNIACRKYFHGTNVINEEYLFFSNDTFIYNAYNQLEHEPIASGKFYSLCLIDTIITFDPETFEEVIQVVTNETQSKEGFWKETINDDIEEGFYKNGHRIGKWVNKNKNKLYKYDSKGKLFREDVYNIIGLKSTSKTLESLTKRWAVEINNRIGLSIELILSEPHNNFNSNWTFTKENSLIVSSDRVRMEQGKWSLVDYNHLIINGINKINEKEFEILHLSNDKLILKSVEK